MRIDYEDFMASRIGKELMTIVDYSTQQYSEKKRVLTKGEIIREYWRRTEQGDSTRSLREKLELLEAWGIVEFVKGGLLKVGVVLTEKGKKELVRMKKPVVEVKQ